MLPPTQWSRKHLPSYSIIKHATLLLHGIGGEHALLWSRMGDPLLWKVSPLLLHKGACSPPTPVIGEHAPLLLHGVGGEHAPLLLHNRRRDAPLLLQ